MNYPDKIRLLSKRRVWHLSDTERVVVGEYSEDEQRVLLIKEERGRFKGRYYDVSEITLDPTQKRMCLGRHPSAEIIGSGIDERAIISYGMMEQEGSS